MKLSRVVARVYCIPTDRPESDGTIQWDRTTAVVVQAWSGDTAGLGLTYASKAAGVLIQEVLAKEVVGESAWDPARSWQKMVRSVRNAGRPGIGAMAISAVDFALWDLKARLLGLPLHRLLGTQRDRVDIYGSGGFTSYDNETLREQLAGWVQAGIPRVKMKVGRDPARDPSRVSEARDAIGGSAQLFVDANGAYDLKQALKLAERFAALGVSWFEEPVSSDDLRGLRFLRGRAPASLEIAAGEYGYDADYFLRMLSQRSVDVLQVDATRCGGITGFLKAAALAEAHHIPLSTHCAPSMHVALGCHCGGVRHLEYFHDHVRIESLIFDGVITPVAGALAPADDRPGFGLTLKRADAERFAA